MDSKLKSTFRKHYYPLLSVCIGITVSLSMHCYVTPENRKIIFFEHLLFTGAVHTYSVSTSCIFDTRLPCQGSACGTECRASLAD